MLPPRPVIGILHPGAMGAAVGAALKPVAGAVIWAAAGRSLTTSKRAETADLVGVPDVGELVRRSDVIVSVCPPDAARAVAEQVAEHSGSGTGSGDPLYVDANAVSPATAAGIAELLGPDRVIDGAIIGPPAWEPGRTVVWLAGKQAPAVAALFAGSPFAAHVLDAPLGAASALKACFALQSKALPTIWLTLDAAARAYGVDDEIRGRAHPHRRRSRRPARPDRRQGHGQGVAVGGGDAGGGRHVRCGRPSRRLLPRGRPDVRAVGGGRSDRPGQPVGPAGAQAAVVRAGRPEAWAAPLRRGGRRAARRVPPSWWKPPPDPARGDDGHGERGRARDDGDDHGGHAAATTGTSAAFAANPVGA